MLSLESHDQGTLLVGERQVLEMIATGGELYVVLDALCRFIEGQSGLASAVYLLDRDGTQLTFAAGPHVPATWRDATPTIPGAPATTAPMWSTPFFSTGGKQLGTFAIAGDTILSTVPADVGLVERAARLASIAVERHVVEASLREGERRFSSVFYLNPAAMAITHPDDGRIVYVNDAFTQLYGYSRAEAVGQTVMSLGLYEDPSERRRLVERLATDGKLRDVEVRGRTKAGEPILVNLSVERVELLGEQRFVAIVTDITDRHGAEVQLRASEQLLRQVLDATPVGVTVTDTAGNVVLTNPAAARVWGRMVEQGSERYAQSRGWWHDTGRRIEADEWASVRALRYGESSVNEVIDIEGFDGVRKIIHNSAVPMRDAAGAIVGAVIINEDVSARKTAERERDASLEQMRGLATRLMRAQEDERRRIAQMLHETTAQDLAALKMLLGGLQRGGRRLADGDRALLDETIELAERSIVGVRTLSYLLYPPFLDENGLLSALRWYASGFSERSGVTVTLDLPPALDRLPQEIENALFRVVQEALINIHRHACSATARIQVCADQRGVTLDIEDSGHGIPADTLAQLNGGGGLGVGIAGMRERMTQLAGTLHVQSDEHGTRVRVRLPLQP